MTRNTGKPSEAEFEARYKKRGKKVWLYRFRDAADLFAMNRGRKIKMPPLPADYLIVDNGRVFLAEVKSTRDLKSFRLSMISDDQWAAAVKTIAAGGDYIVHVHHLITNLWYRIPFPFLQITRDAGMRSVKFSELNSMVWS